jgi:cell fate regulator YaaT (PSP1 superfamily)
MAEEEMSEFITVVGVKFREAGRIYYYNVGEHDLKVGEDVIVNTPIGLGLGTVIIPPTLVPKEKAFSYNIVGQKMDPDYFLANLSPATLDGSIDSEPKVPEQLDIVIRKATTDDLKHKEDNKIEAQKAHKFCFRMIKEKSLQMKLIKTEMSQNGKKAVFYFTSNSRVDFRELVKELLKELKVRIELRQIDLRDETKLIGGIGPCGKQLCCNSFLRQFKPVTIKMAKEQNLALNPTKVSGVCGRLFCCLAYEIDTYNEIKKSLPKVGNKVKTTGGNGKVIKVDIFTSRLDVLLDSGDMVKLEAAEVKEIVDAGRHHQPDITNIIKEGAPEVSEAELKALEDPDKVVDIKDTFMKPAPREGGSRDNRGHDNRGPDNRSRDNRGPDNRGRGNNNRRPR